MSVKTDQPGEGVIVVTISGEIGLDATMGAAGAHSGKGGDNELDRLLNQAVPQSPKLVVVDLTPASYLSSMGIGTLVRLRNRVVAAGQFRVVATGNLVSLLKFGRLDQIFMIYPTVQEALAA